jgi:hypothetical protein
MQGLFTLNGYFAVTKKRADGAKKSAGREAVRIFVT